MYSTQAEEEQGVAMAEAAAATAAGWWGRGRFAEVVENRSAAMKGVRWRRIVVVGVFSSGSLPVSLMVRLGGPLGALRWRMACCRSRSPAFGLGMQCGHDTDHLKRLAMASDLSYHAWQERGPRQW